MFLVMHTKHRMIGTKIHSGLIKPIFSLQNILKVSCITKVFYSIRVVKCALWSLKTNLSSRDYFSPNYVFSTQMNGLKSTIDGLETSVGITRAELEGAMSRMKNNELETRRFGETLQKLQNDLLRDLSEGINEVKEAREKDFSSLEKTVEERLAEVSQSIKVSLEEFTKAQSEAQSQLTDLRARLGDMEDPTLIKQELSAIVGVVAEIKRAKQTSHASVESLGEQIGAVRAELQIRNQEVASLSQEVETVRSVMQETIGNLRKALSAAEASVQALKDKSGALESSLEQVTDAVHHVETQMNEAETQARKQADDLEARVKASEESTDSLSTSISDITSKVESLLSKYDDTESALAANGKAVEEAKRGTQQEMEALTKRLGELQSNMDTLGDIQATLTSKDSDLDQLVKDLEVRLATVEGSSSSEEPEQLRSLRNTLASLEAKAVKLEHHEEAISSLQKALEETTRTLAEIPNVNEKEE